MTTSVQTDTTTVQSEPCIACGQPVTTRIPYYVGGKGYQFEPHCTAGSGCTHDYEVWYQEHHGRAVDPEPTIDLTLAERAELAHYVAELDRIEAAVAAFIAELPEPDADPATAGSDWNG